MKRTTPLVMTIILFTLVAVSLRRDARSAVDVYDYKNAPGSACKIVHCLPNATTASALDQFTNNGTEGPQLGTPDSLSDDPAVGTCVVTCPIIHDHYTDVVGTRFAWIDIGMIRIGTNPSRVAQCSIVYSTGKYSVGAASFIDAQSGPPQTMMNPTSVPSTVQRLNFRSPWPTVPPAAAAHGVNYSDGYAVINCLLPSQTTIYGYGWQEIGGNPNDN